MSDNPAHSVPSKEPTRRHETVAFILLAFVLFPVLSVILVGGFGFVVWMQHLMFGPPAY